MSAEVSHSRNKTIPTKSQPVGLAATPNAVYIPTSSGLEIRTVSGESTVHSGNTTAVGAHPSANGDIIAFGSGAKLTVASVSGTSLKTLFEVSDNRGDILAVAFAKDGSLVASGDVSLSFEPVAS